MWVSLAVSFRSGRWSSPPAVVLHHVWRAGCALPLRGVGPAAHKRCPSVFTPQCLRGSASLLGVMGPAAAPRGPEGSHSSLFCSLNRLGSHPPKSSVHPGSQPQSPPLSPSRFFRREGLGCKLPSPQQRARPAELLYSNRATARPSRTWPPAEESSGQNQRNPTPTHRNPKTDATFGCTVPSQKPAFLSVAGVVTNLSRGTGLGSQAELISGWGGEEEGLGPCRCYTSPKPKCVKDSCPELCRVLT